MVKRIFLLLKILQEFNIFLNLVSEFPYKSLNGNFEDYTIWAWAACVLLNMVGYRHFRVEKPQNILIKNSLFLPMNSYA